MARSRSNSGASDNPPSYEESIASAPPIDSTRPWPYNSDTRDELSTFLQMATSPQTTEPARGRAYTVTGAPERHKHRNIINYFENSLDDVDSIDWSHPSVRCRHMPNRQYSDAQMFDSTSSSTRLSATTTKPHNLGNRVPSRDIIHWQYVKEDHSSCTPATCSRPPTRGNYPQPEGSCPVHGGGEGSPVRGGARTRFSVQPVNTSRETHSADTDMFYMDSERSVCGVSGERGPVCQGSHSLGTLTPLMEEQRPVFSVGEGATTDTGNGLDRQPSAPAADCTSCTPTPHSTKSAPNCASIYPDIECVEQNMFNSVKTAPGRLSELCEKSESLDSKPSPLEKSPEKNVSFWIGNDENSCPNKTSTPNSTFEEFKELYKEKDTAMMYKRHKKMRSDPVIYQQPPVNPEFCGVVYEIPVKQCCEVELDNDVFEEDHCTTAVHQIKVSEKGCCQHDKREEEKGCAAVNISSIIVPTIPLKSDDITRTDSGYSEGTEQPLLVRDKSVSFSNGTKEDEEDQTHLINQSDPEAGELWENDNYYRPVQKTVHRAGWRRWAAITFFVFDLLTILLGLALLLVDYHSNVVAGFSLMGIGAGLCIPALNYLGGFPTVCG